MAKSPSSRDILSALGASEEIGDPSTLQAHAKDGSAYSHAETMEAWERFLTSKQPSNAVGIRSIIEASWQRSSSSGVDARGRGSTQILPRDDVERLRQENDDLLTSARQNFLRIADTLADAATMAIITDARGVILDVGGDSKTIEDAHNICLEIGAAWNERSTGTNGIGTALATGKIVLVRAAEHFCEGVRSWACVGAPIRSPVDGSIIGVVDFSGPHDIFQRHNLALAMISANHIELTLTEKVRTERMHLLEASLRKMPPTGAGDSVIVVDRFGRIIHHNEAAALNLRAMGLARTVAKGSRILDLNGIMPADNFEASLPEEIKDHSVLPLTVDGSVRGLILVLGARERARVNKDRNPGSKSAPSRRPSAEIVGRSPVLLETIDRAERAARGRTSILLEGETGVGKELFARLIHEVSFPSGTEPFVAFNCGAISKELIGGELFGHAHGAFTGATREGRPGRFEAANNGTLALDEIGEMPLELQPYVLRALEEGAIYRLGESKQRPVKVRLIASTNRNLRNEVADGRFRKDLYFRINAVKITIPPLRERLGDVDYLIHHFILFFAQKYGVQLIEFEPDCMDLLQKYDWPGNVRELRNLIESATLMSKGHAVGIIDLPEDIREAMETTSVVSVLNDPGQLKEEPVPIRDDPTTLNMNERMMIENALKCANGNISVAAQRLDVSRSTIYRKLNQYRLSK